MSNKNFSKDVKNSPVMMSRASSRFGRKVRPKSIKKTIKRLLSTFVKEKKILFLTAILVIISTSLILVAPLLLGKAIDSIVDDSQIPTAYYALFLLLLYGLISLINWLSQFMITKASQQVIHNLRITLFKKLENLPLSYFDLKSHGDIMSRFTNDLDAVSNVLSQSTITFLSSVYTVVGTVSIMLYLNLYLALSVLISVPLIYLLSQIISKRTIHKFKGQQKAVGEINSVVEESVYGLNLIQAFGKEETFVEKFREANEAVYLYGKSAQIWSGLLMPLMNVINNLTFSIVGLVGGYLVIKGTISVGIVVSFIAYSRQFVRPLNELAFIYNNLMAAIAGAERVFELLDTENEEKNLSEEHIVLNGNIEFDQVCFAYTEGRPVLKNISFSLEQGKKIAIVGPTGAGKTTIVNLISNFYKASSGRILIDDRDISEYPYKSYLSQLGIVIQDAYLFSGTIYDNISYGRHDATEDEVIRAAELASVDHIIRKLPDGYHTHLTFGGLNLSQGERQLITIARAILANPSVLILDEATSSVDLSTEKHVTEAMTQLMEGRTSVIIAHRLSTIREADLILVLDNGEILEAGSHTQLIQQKGKYFEMIQSLG